MKHINILPLFIVLIVILTLFTGCAKRSIITAEDFETKMTEKGFEVSEDRYKDMPARIISASNGNYEIVFIDFEDVESAEHFYDNASYEFEARENIKTFSVSLNSDTYNYLCFSGAEDYYVVSRVEDTIMFSIADKQYREEITDIMSELGYDS